MHAVKAFDTRYQRIDRIRQTRQPERRSEARIGDCPPLLVFGLRATVQDISRGGVCLAVHGTLPREKPYLLVLRDTLDGSLQEMEAEVVWCRDGHAGLRWTALTTEQDDWLARRFSAWLAARDGASRR